MVCTDVRAIELGQRNKIENNTYFWSHLLLIVFEVGLVILFIYRRSLETKFGWLGLKRKRLRSHWLSNYTIYWYSSLLLILRLLLCTMLWLPLIWLVTRRRAGYNGDGSSEKYHASNDLIVFEWLTTDVDRQTLSRKHSTRLDESGNRVLPHCYELDSRYYRLYKVPNSI